MLTTINLPDLNRPNRQKPAYKTGDQVLRENWRTRALPKTVAALPKRVVPTQTDDLDDLRLIFPFDRPASARRADVLVADVRQGQEQPQRKE